MTTKTLRGTYASGYTLTLPVTTVTVASGGVILGQGLIGESSTPDTIVNLGKVAGAFRSTGVHLVAGGAITNGAEAAVSTVISGIVGIYAKAATSVHDGMMMHYTLEDKEGHWVVVGRSDSQGHGMGAANPNLPGGHPPIGNPDTPVPQQPLPPGHPQVQGTPPSDGQGLPPGHPKV